MPREGEWTRGRGGLLAGLMLLLCGGGGPRGAGAVSCAPCGAPADCPGELQCGGGTTPDLCGCCLECARGAGEACGGPYFVEGRCDEGLVCVIAPVAGRPVSGQEVGVCRGKSAPVAFIYDKDTNI